MENWQNEDPDRKGYYEGFGAFIWLCISGLLWVVVGTVVAIMCIL